MVTRPPKNTQPSAAQPFFEKEPRGIASHNLEA
jgi:hypothetical protein